jgi:26S proteasome regulatory subunit N8
MTITDPTSTMGESKSPGDYLTASTSQLPEVVVHPIVLLSVVDHYNRLAKGTSKRVVGTLLGEVQDGKLHVTNSFGVLFEEDPRDPRVWFLDHNYHENMFQMFKKVNTKERVVGWYSTGPKLMPCDLDIHDMYRQYCPEPVLAIINPQPNELELPTDCYYSVEIATDDKMFRSTFKHVPSTVGAFEAEEIGVEHLLRDIANANTTTLSSKIGDKMTSLQSLATRLKDLATYLGQVAEGKLPQNPDIIYQLQEIFNLLPSDMAYPELNRAFNVEANDEMLGLYMGAVLRTTMGLHNLINNKIKNRETKDKIVNDKIAARKASISGSTTGATVADESMSEQTKK